MAKIEGTQSIPAEWLDEYRATLTEKLSTGVGRKRFPFRLRLFSKKGYKATNTQLEQRSRFGAIRNKFKTVSHEERQRWYAAMPPWHSLLWYYNYFMLSGLMGNAVVGTAGGGVIKDINHYTFGLPAGAPTNVTVAIDTCDPTKAVIFFYGAGHKEYNDNTVAMAWAVYPYLVSLGSTFVIVKASEDIESEAGCSLSLIEYI